jgi:hypothetical protein
VIRERTKPSCYIRCYRKDFGELVDVKRNKNLLDSQCVGCVYARSAMRGKERRTKPRQAENQDSNGDYGGIPGFHLEELRLNKTAQSQNNRQPNAYS